MSTYDQSSSVRIASAIEKRFSEGMLAKLQAYPHFVVWKLTGEKKKLPVCPTTYRAASTTDSATWGTLTQSLKALRSGAYNGIGFVFANDDPFTGIDIDHCVLNGTLTPEATNIISSLWSYTEVSPSNTGVHIIVEGTVPEGRRRNGIEIYSTGRYFTITTSVIKGHPDTIEYRQKELDMLYASLMPQGTHRQRVVLQERQISLSDEKVLEKARNARNGERFHQLYQGCIAGFRSKSEADFTLILYLLYWTNDDIEQVKRLFRQSSLYDEKTERPTNGSTYLDVTIANALKKRNR